MTNRQINVQTLAKDRDYLVTSHLAEDRVSKLVVCFGYQGTDIAPSGFGVNFLLKRGYDVVYVAQRKHTAYQGLPANILADAILPLMGGGGGGGSSV
ncbi:hypothetical protein, partial [Falsirhodobacter sp. alg1]|uniref:hypothetical protein n=1 Tax=Falsirhodobacter sp. alg1 TaxID=1472418 RepID=UPI001EDB24E3